MFIRNIILLLVKADVSKHLLFIEIVNILCNDPNRC